MASLLLTTGCGRFLSLYAFLFVNPKLVDPKLISSDALIDLIVDEIVLGRVAALATDTVFGLIGSAADCDALDSIASIKGRDASVAMPVIIGARTQLTSLVPSEMLNRQSVSKLIDSLWPGPLTIVLPLIPGRICDRYFSGGTVGLRLPADSRLREIAKRAGPIVATSANEHSKPVLESGREVLKAFGGRSVRNGLSVVVDERARYEAASTVVEVSSASYRVIRPGAVSESAVAKAFGSGN